MKIGLVCPYNIFKGGGVQECVLALQKEFVRLGHDASIITPRPRELPEKVPKHVLLVGASADVKSFHTSAQVSVSMDGKELDKLLGDEKFDILHYHEPWVPIMSRQILTRSTSVNVATFHAKLPETAMTKAIERAITPYTKSILKYIDVLTAVSDAAASYVTTLTKKEVAIVPNGIDLKKYAHHNKSKRSQIILYVGRLERRKGVKHLLDAHKQLTQHVQNAQLVIAGDGPDAPKLKSYVKEQKIHNVEFLGFVSEEQKLQLLDEAAVFCSPAPYGESFGIVLLEAIAKQVPIVAGDNPGYSSVLKEKGQLSLVNPKDAEEFARRLEIFLTDNELRNLWQKWANQYIGQFSYEHVGRQYLELYKQAMIAKKQS